MPGPPLSLVVSTSCVAVANPGAVDLAGQLLGIAAGHRAVDPALGVDERDRAAGAGGGHRAEVLPLAERPGRAGGQVDQLGADVGVPPTTA